MCEWSVFFFATPKCASGLDFTTSECASASLDNVPVVRL